MIGVSSLPGLRIALVEDDPAQRKVLGTWLEDEGCRVVMFPEADAFLRAVGRETFDLVLLDWMLPDLPGDAVLRLLRGERRFITPVIMVTSRDAEEDIVAGLAAGADDYLVKPVRRLEMHARIEAAMRRVRGYAETGEALLNGPYRFDLRTRTASVAGAPVTLTDKEFELAVFLFRNLGQMLSRKHIMESVWGVRADLRTRTIDTHISSLRRALDLRAENGFRLMSIHRVGYRLERTEA